MMLFRRQLLPALMVTLCLTALVGLAYPLVVTGVAQATMSGRADGSLVTVDGTAVGSRLIGQVFSDPSYFHSRPSAAREGYDGLSSAGSNLGPSSDELRDLVEERVAEYREVNGLADDTDVPIDAVTASGSGLDPHISVANAELQASRVAADRDLEVSAVRRLIDRHTDGRVLGVLGQPGVNVLELNVALDRLDARRS